MSKSLNKLVDSVFNLGHIFNQSSSLLSFGAEDERGSEIRRQLIQEVAGTYKEVFEKRAVLAENLIFFYFNRTKDLEKIKNLDEQKTNLIKKEINFIKIKLLPALEEYRFYCDLFSKKNNISDIYGIDKLIDITIALHNFILQFEKITTESVALEIISTGEQSMDSIIESVFNETLRKFFGIIVAGSGAPSNTEAILNKFKTIGIFDEGKSPKIKAKFEEDFDLFVQDEDDDNYYENKYAADSDKIIEIENAFKEAVQSLSEEEDALIAASDKLRNKIMGGSGKEMGESRIARTLTEKIERQKNANKTRIDLSKQRLESLENSKKEKPQSQLGNIERSISLEKRVLEILKQTEEELDKQIRNAKIIDAIERNDIGKDQALQELSRIVRESSESKSKLLMKVRQIHYVDPISFIERLELKGEGAERILEETGKKNSTLFDKFIKAKEKYIEIKKNPQNFIGREIKKDENQKLISDLKGLGIEIGDLKDVPLFKGIIESFVENLSSQYKKLKTEGKERSWNPWISFPKIREILSVLINLIDLINKSFNERQKSKSAWSKALSYQNHITAAAMNYLNAQSDGEKSAQNEEKEVFEKNIANARKLLEENRSYLSKSMIENLEKITSLNIDSFSKQINEIPILKFNTSLRYLHGRFESDISQFKRNFIINIARNFLNKKISNEEALNLKKEIFNIIKEDQRYLRFKSEIYIEAFMLALGEARSSKKQLEFGTEFRPKVDKDDKTREVSEKALSDYSSFLRERFPGENFEGELATSGISLKESIPKIRGRLYQELSDYIFSVVKTKVEDYVAKFWQSEDISSSKGALEVTHSMSEVKSCVNVIEAQVKEVLERNFISKMESLDSNQKFKIMTIVNGNDVKKLKDLINNYKEIARKSRLESIAPKIDKAIDLFYKSLDELRSALKKPEGEKSGEEASIDLDNLLNNILNVKIFNKATSSNMSVRDWIISNCDNLSQRLHDLKTNLTSALENPNFIKIVDNIINNALNIQSIKNMVGNRPEVEENLKSKLRDIIIYRYINDSLVKLKRSS